MMMSPAEGSGVGASPPHSPASPLSPSSATVNGVGVASQSQRPEETAFKQQRLPVWQPVMRPPYVFACFFLTGIVFIIIGGVVIAASDAIVEVEIRYDQVRPCDFNARLPSLGYACDPLTMPVQVAKTMKAPVFMYYRLDNFYQNHRRYAKSRSDVQLSNDDPLAVGVTDCNPFLYPGEYKSLGDEGTVRYSAAGPTVSLRNAAYNPCGLIAWSMFNDSIALYRNETSGTRTLVCDGGNFNETGNPIDPKPMSCVKKGIAWESDVGVRYVDPTSYGPDTITYRGWPGACGSNSSQYNAFLCNGWYMGEVGHKIPAAVDEDLMVWMRLASLPTFRKLYRRITTDLEAGSYTLEVLQRFDVRAFSGKKSVILATTNWLGGRNHVLGGLYIGVGALCVILGIAFLVKHVTTRKRHTSI